MPSLLIGLLWLLWFLEFIALSSNILCNSMCSVGSLGFVRELRRKLSDVRKFVGHSGSLFCCVQVLRVPSFAHAVLVPNLYDVFLGFSTGLLLVESVPSAGSKLLLRQMQSMHVSLALIVNYGFCFAIDILHNCLYVFCRFSYHLFLVFCRWLCRLWLAKLLRSRKKRPVFRCLFPKVQKLSFVLAKCAHMYKTTYVQNDVHRRLPETTCFEYVCNYQPQANEVITEFEHKKGTHVVSGFHTSDFHVLWLPIAQCF